MGADFVARDSYQRLLAALDEGWAVEPPVYATTTRPGGQRVVYHFILWRDNRPRVETVYDDMAVREFIQGRFDLEPLH